MIDPKYADLPGIAHDQPDVYETEDSSENKQLQNFEEEVGDSIDKVFINASDAFLKFKNKQVFGESVDFSNNILIKNNIGYSISNKTGKQYTYYSANESLHEKYQRIKNEICELFTEVNSMKKLDSLESNESKSLVDIIYELEKAEKELDIININASSATKSVPVSSNSHDICFKELLSLIEICKCKTNIDSPLSHKKMDIPTQEILENGGLKYQIIYHPTKAIVKDMCRLSYLEKRVAILENFIGTTKETSTTNFQVLKSQGILKSLEKLTASLCLLNGSQLDIMENKITSLLTKMDSINHKKLSSISELEYEKTILDLYNGVKKFDVYFQILPQIIDRMSSLRNLHKKAAEFTNQSKELQELQKYIDNTLINNKSVLKEIQISLSNNLGLIMNDLTALKERVENLNSKFIQ